MAPGQSQKPSDRLRSPTTLLDENVGPRKILLHMLSSRFANVAVQWFTSARETLAIVVFLKRFKDEHERNFGMRKKPFSFAHSVWADEPVDHRLTSRRQLTARSSARA